MTLKEFKTVIIDIFKDLYQKITIVSEQMEESQEKMKTIKKN